MIRIVIGASVALAWFFRDGNDPYADAILGHLDRTRALVPVHWHFEVANVLCISERKGRMSSVEFTQILGFLKALPVDTDSNPTLQTLDDVFSIARSSRLTAYDSGYLALCRRTNTQLATLDKELRLESPNFGVLLFAP